MDCKDLDNNKPFPREVEIWGKYNSITENYCTKLQEKAVNKLENVIEK